MNGPGLGTLIGLAWGDALNERDFANERARLAAELQEANATHMGATAKKNASKALLDVVTKELRLEQEGKLKTRRFSDPKNVGGRAEAFMDTAEGELTRISDGSLNFSQVSHQRVKSSGKEVADILADKRLNPTVVRKPKR